MGHAAPGDVHLEWLYDLERPFLADVELLSAQASYTTQLDTDDGVFPVTVRLPSTPAVERGIANFLTPPRDWTACPRTEDQQWGTHSRNQALGFTGVAINRLAFALRIDPASVNPPVHDDLGPELYGQQVLIHIDAWWENVRTWLEIVTNQRLTQVGHEVPDALNPHVRTSIWDFSGGEPRELPNIGGTVMLGPDRVIGVTPGILRDCLALATKSVPLAWRLLRDVRALQRAGQLRRAVVDAATAAELAVTRLVDDALAVESEPGHQRILCKAQGLGGKAKALSDVGYQLPPDFKVDLVDKRNSAVHEGVAVRWPESEAAFRAALSLVAQVFPLPTAPGSAGPLVCSWPCAAQPEKLLPLPLPRLAPKLLG